MVRELEAHILGPTDKPAELSKEESSISRFSWQNLYIGSSSWKPLAIIIIGLVSRCSSIFLMAEMFGMQPMSIK